MADDIRALSAALARDPSSLQYVELAEALRKKGKLAESVQVALHGLGRHPEHADGYDCLARIYTDRGELAEARAAWERALAIVPEHAGALKGIGFLFFRQGDSRRAVDTLEQALLADPGDESTRRALTVLRGDTDLEETTRRTTAALPIPAAARETTSRSTAREVPEEPVKRMEEVPQLRATAASIKAALEKAVAERAALEKPAAPEPAPAPAAPAGPRVTEARLATPPPVPGAGRPPVFAGLEGATADMLLLDGHGLVMAGGLRAADGSDASELAAAALAGVSGEASRTAGYLSLGSWTAIVAEAENANVVLSPVGDGAMLMLRRDKSTPVGLALRIAERARKAAATWLEEHSA